MYTLKSWRCSCLWFKIIILYFKIISLLQAKNSYCLIFSFCCSSHYISFVFYAARPEWAFLHKWHTSYHPRSSKYAVEFEWWIDKLAFKRPCRSTLCHWERFAVQSCQTQAMSNRNSGYRCMYNLNFLPETKCVNNWNN